jgi:hypothetical protein
MLPLLLVIVGFILFKIGFFKSQAFVTIMAILFMIYMFDLLIVHNL